jgi:UDP-glucose 4-epimerase
MPQKEVGMCETGAKTYLVTGGAGFIGSHLTELLLGAGHRVLAIDDLSTGRMENIERFVGHERYQFARANVMAEVVLDRMASESDIIVHLAAMVGVERIISNPVETILVNVRGTEVVLEAALRYGLRTLVASTSEVYGKGISVPFREEDDVVLGPTSRNRWGYAASKMVDEFLGLAYWQEYRLPVVIMRFFNTVGPRQTGQYGMVIPRFVAQALKNEPITVYGDGNQSRCFCDVSDVVRAVYGLTTHASAPGFVYNIGGTNSISILELAGKIKEITGSRSEIRMIPYDEAYAPGFEDMQRRMPDVSRLTCLLDWKPEFSLEQTLVRVRDQILAENRS